MEELHNAIADARYMGARNAGGLEPLLPMNWPTDEQVAEFRKELLTSDPHRLEFSAVSSSPAGIFLFTRFVARFAETEASKNTVPGGEEGKSEQAPEPPFRKCDEVLKYLDEVEEFRSISSHIVRLRIAAQIWNHFFAMSTDDEIDYSQIPTGTVDEDAAEDDQTPAKEIKTEAEVAEEAAAKAEADAHHTAAAAAAAAAEEQEIDTETADDDALKNDEEEDKLLKEKVSEVEDEEKDDAFLPKKKTENKEKSEGYEMKGHGMKGYDLKATRGSVIYANVLYQPRAQSALLGGEFGASTSCFRDRDMSAAVWAPRDKAKSDVASDCQAGSLIDMKASTAAENGIGFTGAYMLPVRKRIVNAIEQIVKGGGAMLFSATQEQVIAKVFDAISMICVEYYRTLEPEFENSEEANKLLQILLMSKEEVTVESFFSFRILGRGGFGEVHAQKRGVTGKLLAIKIMSKASIKSSRSVDLCWNEREALAEMASPFVVSLKYAYQTPTHVYLALDLMPGGDLCYRLNKAENKRVTHEQARFHAAEVLLGLEHIHSLGYVYRDLKPENILLGSDGHVKISDLGLAVKVTPKLVGTAGTLGYMAPEMFRRDKKTKQYHPKGSRRPYGVSVDWWAFGCIVMEMITGKCPFRTTAAKNYYKNIKGVSPPNGNSDSYRMATCTMTPDYSSSSLCSPEGLECADMCRGLLEVDPRKRLGCSEVLMSDLKCHPWFSTINWGLVATQSCTPPWAPSMLDVNAENVQALQADAQDEPDVELTAADEKNWEKWYFLNQSAFEAEMVEYLQWEEENGPIKKSEKSGVCVLL